MAHTERICSACEGSGEVVHPRDIHKHPGDPDIRLVVCRKCQGDGHVGEWA